MDLSSCEGKAHEGRKWLFYSPTYTVGTSSTRDRKLWGVFVFKRKSKCSIKSHQSCSAKDLLLLAFHQLPSPFPAAPGLDLLPVSGLEAWNEKNRHSALWELRRRQRKQRLPGEIQTAFFISYVCLVFWHPNRNGEISPTPNTQQPSEQQHIPQPIWCQPPACFWVDVHLGVYVHLWGLGGMCPFWTGWMWTTKVPIHPQGPRLSVLSPLQTRASEVSWPFSDTISEAWLE